jgi:hypothetical protein
MSFNPTKHGEPTIAIGGKTSIVFHISQTISYQRYSLSIIPDNTKMNQGRYNSYSEATKLANKQDDWNLAGMSTTVNRTRGGGHGRPQAKSLYCIDSSSESSEVGH